MIISACSKNLRQCLRLWLSLCSGGQLPNLLLVNAPADQLEGEHCDQDGPSQPSPLSASLLDGLKFIHGEDYPVRGTASAAGREA